VKGGSGRGQNNIYSKTIGWKERFTNWGKEGKTPCFPHQQLKKQKRTQEKKGPMPDRGKKKQRGKEGGKGLRLETLVMTGLGRALWGGTNKFREA